MVGRDREQRAKNKKVEDFAKKTAIANVIDYYRRNQKHHEPDRTFLEMTRRQAELQRKAKEEKEDGTNQGNA